MIIRTKDKFGKSVRIEDTGIEPMHPGHVLFAVVLPNIGVSIEDFSKRTRIDRGRLDLIAAGNALFNDSEISALRSVFPRAWNVFRNVQRDYEYYVDHRSWRPLGAPRKDRGPVLSEPL